jgi:hypothetical protein
MVECFRQYGSMIYNTIDVGRIDNLEYVLDVVLEYGTYLN